MGARSVAGPLIFETDSALCTQGTRAELIAAGAVRGDIWPGNAGAKKTSAHTFDAQGRPVRIECYGRQFRAWRKWNPSERAAYEARVREELDRLARENEARARKSEHLKMAELRQVVDELGLAPFSDEDLRQMAARILGHERAPRIDPYAARVRAAESDTDFQRFLRGLGSRAR